MLIGAGSIKMVLWTQNGYRSTAASTKRWHSLGKKFDPEPGNCSKTVGGCGSWQNTCRKYVQSPLRQKYGHLRYTLRFLANAKQ